MTSPVIELLAAMRTHALQDAAVSSFIADRFYDGFPQGDVQYPMITYGKTTMLEDDADCIVGIDVTIQIDVWSQYQAGKKEAFQIVNALKRSLHHADLELVDNALIDLSVDYLDVIDDPDGITSHGVLRLGAQLEEH